MFSQNQEEVKLEWMYKGPHSTVDREEYLLGRSVDKTLEQINTEEKQQLGISQPKNHVEHECIPPSIREYKQQCGDQVDISTKLQEDPLFAIKKQEEEKRRQFLNNPVQIKKLQKALRAQKRTKYHNTDLDAKLVDKLHLLKGSNNLVLAHKKSKKLKDINLDTILMHKYNQLKSKLSDGDLHDIFEGKINSSSSSTESSSSSSSSDDEDRSKHSKKSRKKHSKKSKYHKKHTNAEHKPQVSESRKIGHSKHSKHEKSDGYNSSIKKLKRDRSRSRSYEHQNYNSKITSKDKCEDRNRTSITSRRRLGSSPSSSSSSSESEQPKRKNWGLVKADGTKIPTSKHQSSSKSSNEKPQTKVTSQPTKPSLNRHREKLTEEEKEKRRQEMLINASWREKERSKNLEAHRKRMLKEDEEKKSYDPKFLQKELLKSANSGTVESRIKANINNIQRSGSDMNKHFSRR